MSEATGWKKGLLRTVQILAILLGLVTVLHRNVVRREWGDPWRESDGFFASAYHAVYDTGRRLGLAPAWRMYSPVPKVIHRFEVYEIPEEGEPIRHRARVLDEADRAERSFLDAWLWDVKLARVLDNHLVYYEQYDERLIGLWLEHTRQEISEREGREIDTLRVIVREADIPPPGEKGDWTPETADYDRIFMQRTLRRRR